MRHRVHVSQAEEQNSALAASNNSCEMWHCASCKWGESGSGQPVTSNSYKMLPRVLQKKKTTVTHLNSQRLTSSIPFALCGSTVPH